MAKTDPIVRLEHVSKRFETVDAVSGLDFAIPEGQFVTLLGPSGCGKSTTLRLIGGFETPTEGRILIAGQDVTRLPPNKRDVNMVFQDYALFPHMTVRGNVAFGLELKGLSRSAIDRRIGELLDLVQMQSYEDRTPDQLSGGQRQRVALARALAPDPKVLLLDEPLGALDAKLRAQVQIELKAIQQRTGKTFVFVTHDQEEALTMSDRILVMNAGRVEQDGSPATLYQRPANRFVADFVGDTNFLHCTAAGTDGGLLLLDWGGVTMRAVAPSEPPAPGAVLEVALRPESIICAASPLSLANSFEARIVRQLFKGDRLAMDLLVAGNPATLHATADPYLREMLGSDRVWVGWDPSRVSILAR